MYNEISICDRHAIFVFMLTIYNLCYKVYFILPCSWLMGTWVVHFMRVS